MSCSREGAKAAFLKMQGMPGYPKREDIERKKLSVDAIQRIARSDEHALSIAVYLKTNSEWFPNPKDILDASWHVIPPASANTDIEEEERPPLQDASCAICDGTGWVQGTEHGSADKIFGNVIYAGIRACSCRRVKPNWPALEGKHG